MFEGSSKKLRQKLGYKIMLHLYSQILIHFANKFKYSYVKTLTSGEGMYACMMEFKLKIYITAYNVPA